MPNVATVCHISTMTNWGGVERMLVDLLVNASHRRVRHLLLCTSSAPQVVDSVIKAGVPVFQPRRRAHYDPTAIFQMARWLRQQQVQLVHTYNANATICGILAASLARVPILVAGEHGSIWSVQRPKLWFHRWAYQLADAAILNSLATKKMVGHRYGIPREKMHVVYNAVAPLPSLDVERVRSSLGVGSDVVVGSAGRLVPQKNFELLVQAARIVLERRTGLQFVLIGGGEQLQYLAKLVDSMAIADHFTLTGWRHDARELMQAFDLFVSTSLYEPFGNVFIEAAMAGLPVIAPRVDGVPEAVVDGVTGKLLIPTEQVGSRECGSLPKRVIIDDRPAELMAVSKDALVAAILGLVDKPSLRLRYGNAGKTRAMNTFTIQRYADDLERIYLDLVNRGN